MSKKYLLNIRPKYLKFENAKSPDQKLSIILDETVYLRLVLAGGWGGNDETTDYPDTRVSNFSPQTLFRKCLNTDFIRGAGLCTKVHFFALKKLLQKMKEGTLICT